MFPDAKSKACMLWDSRLTGPRGSGSVTASPPTDEDFP